MLYRKCIRCGEAKVLRDFFGPNPISQARICYACQRKERQEIVRAKKNLKRRKPVLPAVVQFSREHPAFAHLLRKANRTVMDYLLGIKEQEYKCAACGTLMDKFLYPAKYGFVCKACAGLIKQSDGSASRLLRVAAFLSEKR